ncbi:unnamed protein product [Ixodes pacificus]
MKDDLQQAPEYIQVWTKTKIIASEDGLDIRGPHLQTLRTQTTLLLTFTNIVKIQLVTLHRVPLNLWYTSPDNRATNEYCADFTKSMPRTSTVPKLSRRPCRVSFKQKLQFPKTVETFFSSCTKQSPDRSTSSALSEFPFSASN